MLRPMSPLRRRPRWLAFALLLLVILAGAGLVVAAPSAPATPGAVPG